MEEVVEDEAASNAMMRRDSLRDARALGKKRNRRRVGGFSRTAVEGVLVVGRGGWMDG